MTRRKQRCLREPREGIETGRGGKYFDGRLVIGEGGAGTRAAIEASNQGATAYPALQNSPGLRRLMAAILRQDEASYNQLEKKTCRNFIAFP